MHITARQNRRIASARQRIVGRPTSVASADHRPTIELFLDKIRQSEEIDDEIPDSFRPGIFRGEFTSRFGDHGWGVVEDGLPAGIGEAIASIPYNRNYPLAKRVWFRTGQRIGPAHAGFGSSLYFHPIALG